MSPGGFGPPAARPAILAAALLVAQQVAGRATRDALFLSHFDVASLPLMTAAAAVVSLIAVLAFARGMAAFSPARLLPAAVAASALLFLAESGLALEFPRLAAVVVYLHQAVLGAAVISGFWSLINERFDPHTAKRAMGAIGAGASLGGVLGGLLTWGAAAHVSLPAMLAVLGGTGLLGFVSVTRLRVSGVRPIPVEGATPPPLPSVPPSGLRLIRRVPYLRGLALLIALCALLETLLDYVLSAAAAQTFAKGPPLMAFFALLHGVSGLLALAVQGALVPWLLRGLGLAGTLAVQPAFAAAGALLALASPRLASLVVLRAGQAVLRNSAFRSSYELLYTPLPPEQKRPTKVLVDVGCDRMGTVIGSAAVMLVLWLAPSASTRGILALAAVASGFALALASRFRQGYVNALAASLRSGTVTLEPESIVDATTLLTLASIQGADPGTGSQLASAFPATGDRLLEAIADLRSRNLERIRRVLEGSELDPRLVSHVVPLLSSDELFPAAAGALRRAAKRSTGQLVDALLDPRQDPAIRRRIPRVLHAVPTQRCADGLLLGLADERFDVRYRCAQALLRLHVRHPEIVLAREDVLETAVREGEHAADGGRRLEHVFTLLALVLDREPLEIARRALRTGDEALRGTALEYLDNVLPVRVRERLWPHLGGGQGPARSGRSSDEIRDDLLRSTASLESRASRAPSSREQSS